MKNIYKILTIFLVSSLLFSSCDDEFLTVEPTGTLSESNVTSAEGIYNVLNAAYATLKSNVNHGHFGVRSGTVRGGEAMKGRVIERDWPDWDRNNIGLANEGNASIVSSSYGAIYTCNEVIRLANASTELTDAEKTEIIANARFLRAHHYFTAWKNLRNIPWIDETSETDFVPNYDLETGEYIDISDNIIADFEYAAENLEVNPTDKYFANTWAAKVYEAKTLVYQGNYIELEGGDGTTQFTAAKELYDDIIANGENSYGVSYALNDSYKSNFDPENKNSCESILAIQTTINTQYPDLMVGDWMFLFWPNYFRDAAGRDQAFCDDIGAPSQWYVDHFIVDENGMPYLSMDTGITIPDGSESSDSDADFQVDQTIPVDPRLDIVVGRRGVDFTGFGKQNLTCFGTFENPADFGYYRMKKYNTTPEKFYNATISGSDRFAMNMDILKFRDVLLLAAEVEARVGSLTTAMDYVDQIRERASNTDDWVMEVADDTWYNYSDGTDVTYTENYAANYKIGLYEVNNPSQFSTKEGALEAILWERTLELGFEGERFFDLVRFDEDLTELPAYYDYMMGNHSYLTTADYAADGHERLLPFPSTAIANAQTDGVYTLKQNPGF